MPTYDYACRLCGHRFEHFASMSDAPLVRCPECQRDGLQRLIGPGAGILFKGSGFYETDYKRPPPASGDGKAGSPKPESARPGVPGTGTTEGGKSATPPAADAKPAGKGGAPDKGSAPKDKPAG